MYQIINTVYAEMAFSNPADLVNIPNTTRSIFNVRFEITFGIVMLSIAFMLLFHFGIKKGLVGPGLRHDTTWPFGQAFITGNQTGLNQGRGYSQVTAGLIDTFTNGTDANTWLEIADIP